LAQIAADVLRPHIKHPESLTVQKKLIKFSTEKKKELSEEERLKMNKQAWFAVVGLNKDGLNKDNKVKTRKPPKRKGK